MPPGWALPWAPSADIFYRRPILISSLSFSNAIGGVFFYYSVLLSAATN